MACMQYTPKRAKKSSKRAQFWIFTNFFKFRAFITLHPLPPKQHVFLEFLVENKEFYSTKKALRADAARTANNKWNPINWTDLLRPVPRKRFGHSFSTYAKFFKKLTFLTPWYAHVRVCAYVCVSGGKKC